MNHNSRSRIQSKTDPTIWFTLTKVSWGRRNDFNEASAEYMARAAEIQSERDFIQSQEPFKKIGELTKELTEMIAPPEDADPATRDAFLAKVKAISDDVAMLERATPAEQRQKLRDLAREETHIDRAKVAPILLKWGLYSIEGLSIDGVPFNEKSPPDIDRLLHEGPEALVHEICQEIGQRMRMTEEEQKNSDSPTTSVAAAGEANLSTTATSASGTATI